MSDVELYKKYRPRKLSELVGQESALRPLAAMYKRGKLPHALLLTGPSGCGKTTVARILRRMLRCSDSDYTELNAADFRGIDMVRDIRARVRLAPLKGSCRVWLLDEAHELTASAQHAFLKLLEDTPAHVYFFLATTEPQKLLRTIRTRCTQVDLHSLSPQQMEQLIRRISGLEKIIVEEDVIAAIVNAANGSPRQALVILHQIAGLSDTEARLAAVARVSGESQAIELARTLLNPRKRWPDVAAVLRSLDGEPEKVRRLLLAYCEKVLLSGGSAANRAYRVIDCFRDPLYDIGRAGLVAGCYEAMNPDV